MANPLKPSDGMWIIVEREFGERIRSRAFLLSTIFLPLLAVGVFLIPFLLERATGASTYRIAVVDETPEGVGQRVAALLGDPEEAGGGDVFHLDLLQRPLADVRDSLTAAVRAERLDGYLWLDTDFVETGSALYRARVVTDFSLMQRLRTAASQSAREVRLDRAGLDGEEVDALLSPAQVETAQIARTAGTEADGTSTLLFAYFIGFILYFFIILYGTQVMQSVHEEKSNRIAEVLMSTIRAPQLLAGKVFGVGGAALLQIAVWGALVAIAVALGAEMAATLGIPAGALSFQVAPLVAIVLFFYAVLGFFLYAALFATAGAATEDMRDAQQFVWLLLMPLIIPMLLQFMIVSAPHGVVATVLGWIPFTSPLAMPLHMSAAEISLFELTGSLAVLGISISAVSWVAGKIYRVGMLSTGRRPSLVELWRWVRMS